MSVVNSEIIKMIQSHRLENMKVKNNVFGETYISDLRPDSAGMVAQQSGAHFESIVLDILNYCNKNNRYHISARPKFKCHFELNRESDYGIMYGPDWKTSIHIECKQLGNVESHFDKLSHCFMNVISGCYGKHFWLVYDYNREMGNLNKIEKLIVRAKKLKEQVALQGITFETILVDNLPEYLMRI
jgi:hypothetical protein